MILGFFGRPRRHFHPLVARAIELRAERAPLLDRDRPLVWLPYRLRAEQNARPGGVVGVAGIESFTGTEVTHALAIGAGILYEFCGNGFEAHQIADRRAGDHSRAACRHESHDPISGARKPELDSGIQNLVSGCVPPKM
jgi:hypothetical protein